MDFNINGLLQDPHREACKSVTQSFNSTTQSSTSPILVQDISSRTFNLNELLSSSPKDSRSNHRRFNSQASNYLNPRNLFTAKSGSYIKSQRFSLDSIQKKQTYMNKKESFHENEENNTTGSSACKKKSEFGKDISSFPKIFVNVSQNMRYCGNCDKIVEIFESFDHKEELDQKIFQLLAKMVACLEPTWIQGLKTERCCECAGVVFQNI